MIGRGRPVPVSFRAFQGFHFTVGMLYLATAGLLAYFRLVSVPKVTARLAADGADVPGWFPLVSTLAPLLIGLFVLVQGYRHLRWARRAPRRAPGAKSPRG